MPINLGGLQSHIPTASLSKFWENYKPQLVGGLAGAGIGAAGLGGLAAASGEEDPEVKSQNVKRNLLLGASLGGLTGAGAGAAYQMHQEPQSSGLLSKLLNFGLGSSTLMGGTTAMGVNQGLRRTHNEGWNWKGTGGSLHGKSVDALRDSLDEKVKTFVPTAPSAALDEKGIRDTIDRMTANQSLLGRLSQHPLARSLGLNVVDPHAEQNVLQSLRKLTETPEGKASLQRILGARSGSSAMPLMEKALLEGDEGLLARSRAGSAAARFGVGGTAGAGLSLLSRLLGPKEQESSFPQLTR